MADKRKIDRRDFTYYVQVTDDLSKQLIGYLTDISVGGSDWIARSKSNLGRISGCRSN